MGKILICAALLFSFVSFVAVPSYAAGMVDNVESDTTSRTLFSVGEKYCFLITPKIKSTKVSYAVGNEKVLKTFVAGKPTKNADGTTTYLFGFSCVEKGETGIYMTSNGKISKIFSAYVGDSLQQIITKAKETNYSGFGITSEELQLLLTKGGEEGRITFNRIMENAKPVPGEATQWSQNTLPSSKNNYSYKKDIVTSQVTKIDG
ncbi:MAG: hypothetical protein PHU30_04795 [Oscillospiraceae bacterium]|nr:hypothetical protein [Oscillospiraceae bacterium]